MKQHLTIIYHISSAPFDTICFPEICDCEPPVLGPVHTYPNIFKKGDFFLRFQKNTRPHEAFSNRFRPFTRKRNNTGNTIMSVEEHARCYWCHICTMFTLVRASLFYFQILEHVKAMHSFTLA